MLKLIVAVDNNWGISKDGVIPWHYKDDLNFFSTTTTKVDITNKINAIIMGKNSWKTIPNKFRGLKNRVNVIISTSMTKEELDSDNSTDSIVYLARSLNDAINICNRDKNIDSIFICGGYRVYKEVIEKKLVNSVYITHIDKDYNCDNHFPYKEWKEYTTNKDYDCHEETMKCIHYCSDLGHNNCVKLKIVKYDMIYINREELNYLNLLQNIISSNNIRKGRNGVTYSIFGPQLEFDLTKGFPLLTTKNMFWRGVVEELLFFIRGDTNTNHLSDKKIGIWDGNTTENFLKGRNLKYDIGDMGPMYGFQWRHFGAEYMGMNADYNNQGHDQLKELLATIRENSTSRRMLMTTYDPSKVVESVLAPCHGIVVQFYIENEYISCKMYQRSVDTFLGFPFNIASYALFTHIIAHCTGLIPKKLIMTLGDTHIYREHIDQVKEQLERVPHKFPNLKIGKTIDYSLLSVDDICKYMENLEFTDFKLENYKHHPSIRAPLIT